MAKSNAEFIQLRPRADDDLMRLWRRIWEEVKALFEKHCVRPFPGQLDELGVAVEAVLKAAPGSVTVVPLAPGGGKSTLIRAFLKVASGVLCDMQDALARRLGGVIVVVEKSDEAHELVELCNEAAGKRVAVVVESPNDANLRRGDCYNGTATRYEECPRRRCPDHEVCPLMQAASRTMQTPILILLHARYHRYMEDMEEFTIWYEDETEYRRSLLLVDELPNLFDEGRIDRQKLNRADDQMEELFPSINKTSWGTKKNLHYWLSTAIRYPFERLERILCRGSGQYGLIERSQMEEAGFCEVKLRASLEAFRRCSIDTTAEEITNALLKAKELYFGVGQTFSLFLPKLRTLGGDGQPATVIFSGTAQLSPEVTWNPDIVIVSGQLEETYERLQLNVQRGDLFKGTKTGMKNSNNCVILLCWLKEMLPELMRRHRRILLVTYKEHAAELWGQLPGFHDVLIPYINGIGEAEDCLPYFGGLNGSNQYQEATCVICLGLNRFEPQEYLARTLALDSSGEVTAAMREELARAPLTRLETLPPVMDLQDITLARDLVQLIFRSALRRHGEDIPIEVWLFQPPNGVLGYVQEALPGCEIREIREIPEACRSAATTTRTYRGEQTHAAKLLAWLRDEWSGEEITPDDIRAETGLTRKQFKEARKHPDVKSFFSSYILTKGSGRHTKFTRKTDRAVA